MLIPTVPTFTAGESNVTHLQQLSNAVSFLTVASDFPVFRTIKTATAGLSGGSWQTLPYTTVKVDTDNMANSTTGGIQINTQGYYRFEACLEFEPPATASVMTLRFLLTVGPNNANFSNGTTQIFGGMATAIGAGGSSDCCFNMSDICPLVLYPNDVVVVQAFPTSSISTDVLTNSSASAGWFAPQMSAMWIRTGS